MVSNLINVEHILMEDDDFERLLGGWGDEVTPEALLAGGLRWEIERCAPPPALALLPLDAARATVGTRVRYVDSAHHTDYAVPDYRIWEWSGRMDDAVTAATEQDWARHKVARFEGRPMSLMRAESGAWRAEVWVSQCDTPDPHDSHVWGVASRVTDDAVPELLRPTPSQHAGPLTGRRVILTSPDDAVTGYRAVSEPHHGQHGIVVTVVDEATYWTLGTTFDESWSQMARWPIDAVWVAP